MTKPHKILIIEDEAMLRMAYEAVLSAHDFQVKTAVNGIDGLQKMAEFKPDVILLDLLMPLMDGKTFLREADMPGKHPDIRVIVYSNLFDSDTSDEVIGLGAQQLILKSSMSPNQLVEVISDGAVA